MRDVDGEPARAFEGSERADDGRIILGKVPLPAAVAAVEMPVPALGQDVEFLAAVDAVGMAQDAEVLQHIEGAVHGRRDGPRVEVATALDELGAGDVAIGPGQDLNEDPPLRGPAQAT
jgi:hypothetical protein